MPYYLCFFLTSLNSFSQTFSGTGGATSDDGLNNDFLLNVSGLTPSVLNATDGSVSVCIDITHTWDSDLNILSNQLIKVRIIRAFLIFN